MSSTLSSPLRLDLGSLKRGRPAGVFFFVVGACLIAPFAVYAGAAAGNAASTWVSGTFIGAFAPLVFVMALLAVAGVIIGVSGLACGVCGWALLAAIRYFNGVLRGGPRHIARPRSGV